MSQWAIVFHDAKGYRHDALRWAWALGAPYHAHHKFPTDLPIDPKTAARRYIDMPIVAREAFASREILVEAMIRRGQAGERRPMRRTVRKLCVMPEQAWTDYETADRQRVAEGDADAKARLGRMWSVDQNIRQCRTASFLAFDAAGAVDFVRSGVVLGYITTAEAQAYVFDLAREVAATYASWEDYARDFKIGRDFSFGAVDDPIWMPILEDLLNSPKSPWVRLPFTFPETDETAAITSTTTRAGPFWTLEGAPPAATAAIRRHAEAAEHA